MPHPEDQFDQNRNLAAIREAIPIQSRREPALEPDDLYRRLTDIIAEREAEMITSPRSSIAIDAVLQFVLYHEIPVPALYAHNKEKL